MVALLVVATIVGLPLRLGTLLALGLVYGIGYAAGAWVLGRTVTPRARPILSFLTGGGILRVVALVPVLGGLSWFAAVVVGLGAIAVAAYRARRRAPVPTSPAPRPAPGRDGALGAGPDRPRATQRLAAAGDGTKMLRAMLALAG
jgi:hypothetical protein